jgi:hypothetical protein
MSALLPVDVAVARVADGDQVLGNVERTPWGIPEVVRFGRRAFAAAFALAGSPSENLSANL